MSWCRYVPALYIKKGKEVIQSKLNMDKNVDLLKENKDKETTTFR
jgi:hypothetical protein